MNSVYCYGSPIWDSDLFSLISQADKLIHVQKWPGKILAQTAVLAVSYITPGDVTSEDTIPTFVLQIELYLETK